MSIMCTTENRNVNLINKLKGTFSSEFLKHPASQSEHLIKLSIGFCRFLVTNQAFSKKKSSKKRDCSAQNLFIYLFPKKMR